MSRLASLIPPGSNPASPFSRPAMLIASNARAAAELGGEPTFGDLRAIIGDAWLRHSSHPEGYEAGC